MIELQWLLSELLENNDIKTKLVSSVCAIEGCTYQIQNELLNYEPTELAKTLISGTSQERQLLFAPIPNFIFTRDIGITIKDHVLLNKPAKKLEQEKLCWQNIFSLIILYFRLYKEK